MFGKKKVKREISKLSLEQGDVVVLRTNKNFREWIKVLDAIIHRIKDFKKIDVTALILPNDVRFGKISEKEMNAAGWFKQDAKEVSKILDQSEMYKKWNDEIKKLHVEEAGKAFDEIERLKERLKQYEN